MNHKSLYHQKLLNIPEAVGMLESNQTIAVAVIGSEPAGLLTELGKQYHRLKNVDIYMGFALRPYEILKNENVLGHLNLKSFFYGASERKAHQSGIVSYMPGNLGENAANVIHTTKGNLSYFWGTATPPDKNGYMSLSIGMVGQHDFIDVADTVILEINENLPWTYGDTLVHISDVDYVVENHISAIELPKTETENWQKEIGNYIAEMIEDGSTIQLGIGGIPDAIASNLMARKDLGIHTEMLTSGIVDLYHAGVITGKKKTLLKEKIVCTFALGSKELYEFMHRNPVVEVHRGGWVNDPYVIAQNYKQISVNTAIMVDINGQVSSQSVGSSHYSGTGGQLDYHIGAQKSEGGRAIIALRSTAKQGSISAIVPTLPVGSEVTVAGHQVDTIVTEFGVAEMIGKTQRERMEALIKIAHPKFRDSIREEAHKLGIVPKIKFSGFKIKKKELHASDKGITPDSIKIGTVLDLSGPNSLVGMDILHGLEAYTRYTNNNGGINGRALELIVKDNGFDSERTKQLVQNLVEDEEVFALTSILGTTNNLAVMDYLVGKNMPVICPHSGMSVWAAPLKRNYFAYQLSYKMEGKILAQYVNNFLKSKKIAVFAVDDNMGQEGVDGFTNELKQLGIEPVCTITHLPDQYEPKQWVAKLKEHQPDLVMLYSYINSVGQLLEEAYFSGLKTEWLGSYILSGDSLFKVDMLDAVEGLRTATYRSGPSNHRGERLFKKYMKRDYNIENPGTFCMMGFTSAQIVVEGLKKVGENVTREKFIEALEELKDWSGGLFGSISYSKNDHYGVKSLSIQKAIKGKWIREQVELELK